MTGQETKSSTRSLKAKSRSAMAKRTDGRSRDRAASKAIDTMVSKLDPLLILGALSPGREKLAKGKGGKEVGFVVGTLTAQLGPKALEQLKKEDLVPSWSMPATPTRFRRKWSNGTGEVGRSRPRR